MKSNKIFLTENELPQPLTVEQFNSLILEFQKGNIEAKKKLIEHNIRLVLKEVLSKFCNMNYEIEDLIEIGIIGLIKSIETYKIEKNVKFYAYAKVCIDNEILMYDRKMKRHQYVDSLDEFISNDYDCEIKKSEIICDDIDIEEDFCKKETYMLIKEKMQLLPYKTREMMILYFGFNNKRRYTQKEISKMYSLSQSHVSRIIKNGCNQLKIELLKSGYNETETNLNNNKIKMKHL